MGLKDVTTSKFRRKRAIASAKKLVLRTLARSVFKTVTFCPKIVSKNRQTLLFLQHLQFAVLKAYWIKATRYESELLGNNCTGSHSIDPRKASNSYFWLAGGSNLPLSFLLFDVVVSYDDFLGSTPVEHVVGKAAKFF